MHQLIDHVCNNALMHRTYCKLKGIRYLCEYVVLGSTHFAA